MEKTRPVIFIKPYTKILSDLKESVTGSNGQTELYEAANLEEAVRLVLQLNHALVLAAHPKLVAQLLQSTRNHIRRLGTKILLISPKSISQRTIDKFTRIGLSECFIEPVSLRTLEHKVNFLLRAMSTRREAGEFTLQHKNESAKDTEALAVEQIAKKVNLFFDDERSLKDEFEDEFALDADALSMALVEDDIAPDELKKQLMQQQRQQELETYRKENAHQNHFSTHQTLTVTPATKKIETLQSHRGSSADKIDRFMTGKIKSAQVANTPKENESTYRPPKQNAHLTAQTKTEKILTTYKTTKSQKQKSATLDVFIKTVTPVAKAAEVEKAAEVIPLRPEALKPEAELAPEMPPVEVLAKTLAPEAQSFEVSQLELITAKSLIHCLNLYQDQPPSLEEVLLGIVNVLKKEFALESQIYLVHNETQVRALLEKSGNEALFRRTQDCPHTSRYYEKNFERERAVLYYPIMDELKLLAWAECYSDKEIDYSSISCIETILATSKGIIAQQDVHIPPINNNVIDIKQHKESLIARLLKKLRAA